jgi:hypothetical protein
MVCGARSQLTEENPRPTQSHEDTKKEQKYILIRKKCFSLRLCGFVLDVGLGVLRCDVADFFR